MTHLAGYHGDKLPIVTHGQNSGFGFFRRAESYPQNPSRTCPGSRRNSPVRRPLFVAAAGLLMSVFCEPAVPSASGRLSPLIQAPHRIRASPIRLGDSSCARSNAQEANAYWVGEHPCHGRRGSSRIQQELVSIDIGYMSSGVALQTRRDRREKACGLCSDRRR